MSQAQLTKTVSCTSPMEISWLHDGEILPDQWQATTWGALLQERSERAKPGDELLSVTASQGIIPQSEAGKRDTSSVNKSKYKRVMPGDLVYNTMRMWQGVSAMSAYEGIVSPAYTVCFATNNLIPAYGAELLRHPRSIRWFHRYSQGLVNDTLNLKYAVFSELPIVVPSVPEQRLIMEILDAARNAVETSRLLVEKLKSIQSGLRQDLITYGVNTNGQIRTTAVCRDIQEDECFDPDLSPWTVVDLSSVIAKVEYGISVPLSDAGQVPVLRMNNIQSGKVDLRDLKYSDSQKARALQLRIGDVLFNRTNSIELVGKSGEWTSDMMASFASYLIRLTPYKELVSPKYLSEWLNLPATQQAIKQVATVAIQQANVNPTNLQKLPIALPSLPEQQKIVALLSEMDDWVSVAETLLNKRAAVFHGLRDDLLTGKVRVCDKWAEQPPIIAVAEGQDPEASLIRNHLMEHVTC